MENRRSGSPVSAAPNDPTGRSRGPCIAAGTPLAEGAAEGAGSAFRVAALQIAAAERSGAPPRVPSDVIRYDANAIAFSGFTDATRRPSPARCRSRSIPVIPRLPAHVGPHRCGPGEPLLVIAGPCVMEHERLCFQIAETLAAAAAVLPIRCVFKASFDKANRTSAGAFRGPGLDEGLAVLEKVRRATGLPVTTDMHLPDQAPAIGEVCDLIQIPAFLCRQTDLLLAAAATGRAVNVKKGQFVAPGDMKHAVAKLLAGGCQDVMLCERGTFFGYGRLVNDFTGLPVMRRLGVPVIFDATHSVQQPASLGDATGGDRTLVEPLARAAVAVGVDGLFLETHPDPDSSPSDGPNMVPLDRLRGLLERVLRIHEARLAGELEIGS